MSEYQVMRPFAVSTATEILEHPHGIAALKLFLCLLVDSSLQGGRNRWIPITAERLQEIGAPMPATTRRRGVKALQELGLIELRQTGNRAYQAKLLYKARALKSAEADPETDPAIAKALAADDTDAVLGYVERVA